MSNNVEPEILMNSILGKITDVLLSGDAQVVAKNDDHKLAFMSPGYVLNDDTFDYASEGFGGVLRRNANPEKLNEAVGPQSSTGTEDAAALAADARQKYQNAESFFVLSDLVADTSGILETARINNWQPETRVSQAYAEALQFSQVYDVQPDEETAKKIEHWRSLLQTTKTEKDLVTGEERQVTTESELVKRYNDKMNAYFLVRDNYMNARVSAMSGVDEQAVHYFAMNGPSLQMRLRAAENDWISNGYRDEYDRINAAIAAVEGRSFALLKQRYKEDYFRSLLTNPSSNANFLYTAPAPVPGKEGWTKFYFNSSSYQSNHKFSKSDTAGVGGFSLGVFTLGAKGSATKSRTEGTINTETFKFSCEMCRFHYYRPGINIGFPKSGWWRYDPHNEIYKNTVLSTGGDSPEGRWTNISTDGVLVRNLEMDFGENNSHYERELSKLGASGIASFGPFHLGGRHSNASDERTYEASWSSQGVRISGTQLIANFIYFFKDLMPNPNKNITTWT